MSLPGYDRWLEAPYQERYGREMPSEAEDLMGVCVWVEEDDAWGEVEDYEPWSDADEDGFYGGIDLIVRTASQEHYLRPDVVEAMMQRDAAALLAYAWFRTRVDRAG